jgi:hypothetical protein
VKRKTIQAEQIPQPYTTYHSGGKNKAISAFSDFGAVIWNL